MALKDYKSECELHQKIIKCRDKGNSQEYIANNNDKNEVYKYQIDGYVIENGKRCDYLLWNEDKKDVYFIELKGSDLTKAIEQMEETERILKERYKGLFKSVNLYYRVVLNRTRTHKLNGNKVKHFMVAHNGRYKFGTRTIEENI